MNTEPHFLIVTGSIVILLLVLSAVISAAEAALTSVSSDDVKEWENDNRHSYRRILVLMQEPEKLSATLQVSHTLTNVTLVILAAYLIFSMFDPTGGIVVIFVVVMILVLSVFGEIAPRMYASQNVVKIFPRLSLLLLILQKTFYPLSVIQVWITSAVRRRTMKNQGLSIDALSHAFENSSKTSETSENILKGIVKFGSIDVHTIMTPRTDVESVDMSTGLNDLLAKINDWGYSRIPVYDNSPDNVKGILYVKDLLPHIEEKDDFAWQTLIRAAYFVPENKKIDDLLHEFQKMKMHLAVIIDEYGGMVGIVTLEDILEEIMGDITDESDDDEQDYIKIDERTYLFDGKVLLNDFFRIMRLNESDFETVRGEADTLAGVILEMKGEIPQKGDSADFMHLSFNVESVDKRRIKQIKVVVHDEK